MPLDIVKVLGSTGDNVRSGASLCEDLSLLRPGAIGSQGGRYNGNKGWSAVRSDRSGLG